MAFPTSSSPIPLLSAPPRRSRSPSTSLLFASKTATRTTSAARDCCSRTASCARSSRSAGRGCSSWVLGRGCRGCWRLERGVRWYMRCLEQWDGAEREDRAVLSDFNDLGMLQDLVGNIERAPLEKEARERIQVVGHIWGEDCAPLKQCVLFPPHDLADLARQDRDLRPHPLRRPHLGLSPPHSPPPHSHDAPRALIPR